MSGSKAQSKPEAVKAIGVIPARWESVRLPGKVLAEIAGKPMLRWVYEAAKNCPDLAEVVVASDSPKVLEYCADAGIAHCETREHHSGSDRVHEVMERSDAGICVNIQGDEPTLQARQISLLVQCLRQGEAQVSTLKVRISPSTARNPNVVKVVTDIGGGALYFSRHPIPFDRDGAGTVEHFKHIGIYAYTRESLRRFHSLPPSPLERSERLEQLRLLEHGIPIQVLETDFDTIGVDIPEDLERVRAYFAGLAS